LAVQNAKNLLQKEGKEEIDPATYIKVTADLAAAIHHHLDLEAKRFEAEEEEFSDGEEIYFDDPAQDLLNIGQDLFDVQDFDEKLYLNLPLAIALGSAIARADNFRVELMLEMKNPQQFWHDVCKKAEVLRYVANGEIVRAFAIKNNWHMVEYHSEEGADSAFEEIFVYSPDIGPEELWPQIILWDTESEYRETRVAFTTSPRYAGPDAETVHKESIPLKLGMKKALYLVDLDKLSIEVTKYLMENTETLGSALRQVAGVRPLS